MEKFGFIPNGNRVLVKLDEDSGKTAGGLFIPATSEKEQRTGTVVATSDKYVSGLVVVNSPFNVGDRVLVDPLGSLKLQVEGETLHVIRHEDIIGRFILS